MHADQISIFLENKEGRLAQVTSTLANAGVNIRALSLADTSDFGVLRIMVNDIKLAETILKEKGFTVGKTKVVAVLVNDKPGGLHNILNMLDQAKINVEYMYAYAHKKDDEAIMIFKFDPLDEAIGLLQKNKFTIIHGDKLSKI